MPVGPPADDSLVSLDAELPPPPAGPALTAALRDLPPVRTRVPVRAFVLLLAVLLICAAVTFSQLGTRHDLGALPLAWVLAMGVIWFAAGPFVLARAVLPARGNVLPDAARAGRTAIVVAAGLVLLGLIATVDAAGVTRFPSTFLRGWWHCTTFALRITVPLLLGAAVVLRHLHPMGGGQIGAAVGAAGGAWAGFVLHLICPLGGGAHVGFAHGGAAVMGAGLGALFLGHLVLNRSADPG
jgi:hypothetical protein